MCSKLTIKTLERRLEQVNADWVGGELWISNLEWTTEIH